MSKSMKRRKISPLEPGTFFVVPTSVGFVLGVIARHRRNIVFAYFFPVVTASVPTLESIPVLSMKDVLYAQNVGDDSLRSGRWIVLGVPPWSENNMWPFPEFRNALDNGDGTVTCLTLSEKDLLTPISSRVVPLAEARNFPIDSTAGSEYVELVLGDYFKRKHRQH